MWIYLSLHRTGDILCNIFLPFVMIMRSLYMPLHLLFFCTISDLLPSIRSGIFFISSWHGFVYLVINTQNNSLPFPWSPAAAEKINTLVAYSSSSPGNDCHSTSLGLHHWSLKQWWILTMADNSFHGDMQKVFRIVSFFTVQTTNDDQVSENSHSGFRHLICENY